MKFKLGVAIILSLFSVRSVGIAQQSVAANSALSTASEAGQVALPQQAPAEVRVQLGKSLLITSQEPLQRVSVTDPTVASAVIVSPTQIVIHGLKAGSGTLILWDAEERARSFNLTVDLDINLVRETLRQMFPNETLQAQQSGAALVLTGNVSSKLVSDRAAALAATLSPSVVNLVTTTDSRQVVLLQVRFAEVDRGSISQIGLNLFSTGGANTIGVVGTHQFEQTLGNVGAVPAEVEGGSQLDTPNVVGGGIGRTLRSTPAAIGLTDLLNLFIFRADLNLGMALKALQQQNVLQILAEPNIMAINGTEASFLAGGEFPFPVLQGQGGINNVTIQFKEFGVRLNFTPTILPDGGIRLKVSPEVSSLDFANALSVSGFLVPALSSRKATAEVELRDGQSFAIAGLIDNRLTDIASKVPVLGDVPILGKLFRSRNQNKANTELLVMVTPRLVQGLSPSQLPQMPDFPKPFINPDTFDGKSGETPARRGSNPEPPVAVAPAGRGGRQ